MKSTSLYTIELSGWARMATTSQIKKKKTLLMLFSRAYAPIFAVLNCFRNFVFW
jgi:hypothetical protein